MAYRRRGTSVLFVGLILTLALLSGARPADAAAVTITTGDDEIDTNGQCSLREAIRNVNAGARIHPDCDAPSAPYSIILGATTYRLTIAGPGEEVALTGDLDVMGTVTIVGAGALSTRVEAGPSAAEGIDRVFHIRGGTTTLTGLTVQHGNDPLSETPAVGQGGGGIRVDAGLVLQDVTVKNNRSQSGLTGAGGGIWSAGGLTATNVTVSGNSAGDRGGGIANRNAMNLMNVTISGNFAFRGGGLHKFGTSTLNNVTITANSAAGSSVTSVGGIKYHGNNGPLTLRNTIVAGNIGGGSSPANCRYEGSPPFGVITSAGHNLESTNQCTFNQPTDQVNTDPMLNGPANNAGQTQTHSLQLGSPAIDRGNPGTPGSGDNACATTDQRGLSRVDIAGVGTAGTFCDIGAYEAPPPNAAPTVILPSGNPTYAENAAPELVDGAATVTDPDSADFNGGALTVSLTANVTADDRLGIRDGGDGGQVAVSGNTVSVGGTPIGTFAGGSSGSTPLVVTLNAGATPAATQDLVRAVAFTNVSIAPSTAPRSVRFVLTDGDGGTSAPVTKTVSISSANDAPTMTLSGSSPSNTENGAPTQIDAGAAVGDPDSSNFDTGTLTVDIPTNGSADDRLLILNVAQITTSGNQVSFGGTPIGTFAGGTNGTTPLVVSLNASATPAAAEALARSIAFQNVSESPSAANRTVRFLLTDGDGGTSTPSTNVLAVVAVNDPPVIALPGPPLAATNTGPFVIDATATVADVDSANFDTGTLTVDFTANGAPSDRLGIRNQGTAPGQIGVAGNVVSFGGTPIGTFGGGTSGTTPLVVTLNAGATPPAAQALLRNVTYENVASNPPTTPRTVRAVLADGDGGTGAAATKSITLALAADLAITLADAPDPVLVGASLTYTLTVTNTGPSAASNVRAASALPPGVTFTSATPSGACTNAAGTVTCALGTLAGGAGATATIVVSPTAAGTLTTTATVVANEVDPVPANNASAPATTTVNGSCAPRPNVGLAVRQTGPGTLEVKVTAGRGTLQTVRLDPTINSVVDAPGFAPGLPGNVTITPPAGATETTFVLRRSTAGQSFRVPMVVTDGCGTWETFAGGGTAVP